jgi:hypothetical protein
MRSRRVVCVLVRQERKAVQEEDAAWVASPVEAEEEWCMILDVEAWVMGNWVGVVMGLLSIQRGILELGDDMMLVRYLRGSNSAQMVLQQVACGQDEILRSRSAHELD